MSKEEEIKKYVEENAYLLDEDTILKWNCEPMNTLTLNNVIIGIEPHCFSMFMNENKENTYNIYYVNNTKSLTGMLLEVQLEYKYRNEAIFIFSSEISSKYGSDTTLIEIFNTFQHFFKSIFESQGYFTYNDEFDEYTNPILILKGKKGAIQVPFYSMKKEFKKIFEMDIEIVKLIEGNKIYLMYNDTNGLVKIGRSINPSTREKTLQGEAPKTEIIALWNAPIQAEKKLHQMFENKRLRGEWFNLDLADLLKIKDYMSK